MLLLTQQEKQLRRMRYIATSLLVAMALIFVAARSFQAQYPWLSFLAAFTEAAMVGALADWFAVTALFRSPFGLPIPHTGIIPKNKDRIGHSVAEFLEHNFLTAEVINSELAPINFAKVFGNWLQVPDNRSLIIKQIPHVLLPVLSRVPADRVIDVLRNRVNDTILPNAKLAPLFADLISTLVSQGRHQQLFDVLHQFCTDTMEHNRPLIRQRIHERSPKWIPQSVDERFFVGLLEELDSFLDQMKEPESEWRNRFEQIITEFSEKLRTSSDLEATIRSLFSQGLQHPAITEYGVSIWRNTVKWLENELLDSESGSTHYIDRRLQTIAHLLNTNNALSIKLNSWTLHTATHFIVKRRSLIANLVRRVIQSWDGETVSRKFELYIGRDLQFIRINGTVVGGIAGLVLHCISLWL